MASEKIERKYSKTEAHSTTELTEKKTKSSKKKQLSKESKKQAKKQLTTLLREDSKIKGIIFDFDGVLSSFEMRLGWPILNAALQVKPNISQEQIIKVSLEAFTMMTDLKKQKISMIKFFFDIGKRFGMTNLQAAKFVIVMTIMYYKNRKNIVPKIGVREVLQEILSQNYKVVLLTNASRSVIDVAAEKIPELYEFDLVITRDDTEAIKPDAAGFFKALKVLDLQADQVISVGDQVSDIVAGKKAGLRTVAITGEFTEHTKPQLKEYNPDFLIQDVRDLPKLLVFLRDCIIEDIRTTVDLTEQSIQELCELSFAKTKESRT
ncbi:MAG: HAD-IA family hydrolase [Candidatus Heimdallarchaeota archaeon]|nr:HAD-IA family hydrolase [Candidatus Heimdallarchaeota archaeon]